MLHTYYHGVLVAIDAACNARYHRMDGDHRCRLLCRLLQCKWRPSVVCYVGCYSVNGDHRSFVM